MKITALKDKINKYQHLKVTFWIAVVAIITLIVSFIACSPWNSILQNVFAGLVTGLVITLIGSLKGKELKDTELEREFFTLIHDQYLTVNKQFREYRKYYHAESDDYYEALEDLVVEMNSFDTYIVQEDRDDLLINILEKNLLNSSKKKWITIWKNKNRDIKKLLSFWIQGCPILKMCGKQSMIKSGLFTKYSRM